MANEFPIIRTQRTISGQGPSVRAAIQVPGGGIGAAIAGIGETLGDIATLKEKIAAQRRKDLDTRSITTAESFLKAAAARHLDFRERNADTALWEANLKEENRKALEQAGKLDMSPEARGIFLNDAEAFIFVSETQALVDITKQEKEDTFEAVTNNLIEAIEAGRDVNVATRRFKQTFKGRVDKDELDDRLKAAIKVGEENRAKAVLNIWQARIAENPVATANVLNEELKDRGEGRGVIPEEALSSETIQSLLNTATNRISQLQVQSNEDFNNRKGEATDNFYKLLVNKQLTEQMIDAVDLNSFGAQKETEVKWKREWKKILRDTVALTWPVVSETTTYDSLTTGSALVERGTKSPAEWEQEFSQAWADGKLSETDWRDLRSKDIVATRTMQNRAFTETTSNEQPRLVELRDDELAGLVAARDNALKLKDLKTVNTLNFSIKKAQIQKWNYGRFRRDLRTQMSENPDWSQKQVFVAGEILAEQYDKPIADLMLEFEVVAPQESILKTPPDNELKDIWKDLSQEDKTKVWELRMLGASVREITRGIIETPTLDLSDEELNELIRQSKQ